MYRDINKDEIENFVSVVTSFADKADFTLQKPSASTLTAVKQIWNSRNVFGVDKRLYLILNHPKEGKNKAIEMFKNTPSIVLRINGQDGQEIPNNSIIKSDSTNYYEGNINSMLIFNKLTKDKYMGEVKSETELEPHGDGIKIEMIGTKDQIYYKGQFADGKKHGYGREQRKNQLYDGLWENNQKHGYGSEYIKRKKRAIEKNQQSQKSQKDRSEEKVEDDRSDGDAKQEELQNSFKKDKKKTEKKQQGQKPNQEFSQEKKKQLLKIYKSVYRGPWEKGSKSGKDGLQFNKYGTYQGSWQAGAKNGIGIMRYKGGAVYQGKWSNNVMEGKGQYKDQAGNVYVGQFQNGIFDGEGEMKYVNGDSYVGNWSKGRKHGTGIYNYADGDYYDGQWVKDSAEGQGTLMVNGIFFQGQFLKGMKHGLGEETNQDGDVIKGEWVKNKLHHKISINGELCDENEVEE